ncbi:MAG: two-component regulator propeller domain-containing protein, partial [Bacteroidota bacterium]
RRGEVWAGTRRGLYRFGVDGATLSEYSTELSDLRVSSLREDENGNLWVGTHRGLDYLDVSRQKISADHRIPDIFVRSMTVDSSQRLWIGTFDGILVREASGNLRTVRHELANPNSLPDNKIRALFTDSNGTVWVGTYYGGINTWHENQLNFARIDEANGRHLSRRVVSSLAEDENGRLYFGTEGEGVTVLDPATDTYRYLGRRSGQQRIGTVKALAYREKRGLWIGTYDRGLMHYDPTDERIVRLRHDPEDQETPSTDGILSLCATPEDLWIGSVNGALDRLRFSDGRLTRLAGEKATGLGLGVGSIRALATNDTGNLFFGTTQGVYRIAREDIRTETYALKPLSLPAGMESSLYVQDIVAGPDGTVWVATLQRGLYRIVGDTLERVELPGVSSLFAIVTVASGQIWLSSKEGLIHYDPGTGERRIFAARDGVPRNEFGHGAGLYTSSGKLFFGGASGATVFTPQRLGQWDDYAPDVVITDLKLSGRPVLPGDSTGLLTVAIDRTEELEFAYDQNDFTFHFALPNFVRTEQNTYYYRLLGLDDEWTKTSRPEVTYTIQRGGNYVFEVRGENSYGVPTAAITRLPLRVHPPRWRSWWAYLLYASIILGTMLTLILMYRGR